MSKRATSALQHPPTSQSQHPGLSVGAEEMPMEPIPKSFPSQIHTCSFIGNRVSVELRTLGALLTLKVQRLIPARTTVHKAHWENSLLTSSPEVREI